MPLFMLLARVFIRVGWVYPCMLILKKTRIDCFTRLFFSLLLDKISVEHPLAHAPHHDHPTPRPSPPSQVRNRSAHATHLRTLEGSLPACFRRCNHPRSKLPSRPTVAPTGRVRP